jgi:hypothetical protein
MRVPVIFENARGLLMAHLASLKEKNQSQDQSIPIITYSEALQLLAPLNILQNESLQILHLLGIIHILRLNSDSQCPSPNDVHQSLDDSCRIVLDPKWLTNLLATVVTFRHQYVKNGLIAKKDLLGLWRHDLNCQNETLSLLLVQYLIELDVMHVFGQDHFIVPCMLPDQDPPTLWSLGKDHHEGDLVNRGYLIQDEEGHAVPLQVEVLGKIFSVGYRLGRVRAAWRSGCVIECEDGDTIFRLRKEVFLVHTDTSYYKNDAVVVELKLRTSRGIRVFQQLNDALKSVLTNFYHYQYTEIVPIKEDDWFEIKDIIGVFQSSGNPQQMIRSRSGNVEAAASILCPDLCLSNRFIVFEQEEFELKQEIGKGAFGQIFLASHKGSQPSSNQIDEKGSKIRHLIDDVVVKKIMNFDNSGDGISACSLTSQEVYDRFFIVTEEAKMMAAMNHPNIVQLYGVCIDQNSLWLIVEYLPGKSLFDQISDPYGLRIALEDFWSKFDTEYNLTIFNSKGYEEAIGSHLLSLHEAGEQVPSQGVRDKLNEFLESAKNHWENRSSHSFREMSEKEKKVRKKGKKKKKN